MTPERWAQIRQIFEDAVEQAPENRSAFLEQACGPDLALRHEVEALLAEDHPNTEFLNTPALEVSQIRGMIPPASPAAASAGTAAASWLPEYVGHYRIVRLVGQGGMGAVYEAEQDQPRRVVALKVIRPGMSNPELLRRFARESQALGRLQHPGIAQIYEAGTADTGFGPQPYFAMELIRGRTLLDHAAANRLNPSQRLQLMTKVCEAVEHAHQRSLIHRDLKPGNILVDETGQPKILDFGVARVTDTDVQVTRQTDWGQLVGTLAYMSPEQVTADPLDLDTRSDVYALGVILYELLAGRPPYHLSGKLHEATQAILGDDPTPLSTINRNYRGDVETIVAKALEKDKARRYGSAAALADDIRRHLNHEPITARPPSASYQLRKFARRHRAIVAGIAAVFVVLVGGIIASTREAVRARRAEAAAVQQRDRADSEAATEKAISEFLQNDLLAQAGASAQTRPDNRPDPDLKVRTALERAASRLSGKFDKRPALEASLRQTIGDTYRDLGLYPEAQAQMERAMELRRRSLGEQNADTLYSETMLAHTLILQGRYAAAEPLLSKVLEIRRRVLGAAHPDTLDTMDALGGLYLFEGKYAQAEALRSGVVDQARRVLGPEHPDTLVYMNNLAFLYGREGRYQQAETLFVNALEGERRTMGEDHPESLKTMQNLAQVYRYEGKYDQAEALLSRLQQIQKRVLGEEHPEFLTSMSELALVRTVQGRYQEAEALYSRLLDVESRVLGKEDPSTPITLGNLASLYREEGKYGLSEASFANALAAERRVLGPQHPNTLVSMHELALLYLVQHRYAESEALFTDVLKSRRRILGEDHPRTLGTLVSLGRVQLEQQKYSEAERTLRDALGRYEKTGADLWERFYSQALLGASLMGQKRYAEAEPILIAGYSGMMQRAATIPSASRHTMRLSGERIVALYEAWDKPEKAAEWRARLGHP